MAYSLEDRSAFPQPYLPATNTYAADVSTMKSAAPNTYRCSAFINRLPVASCHKETYRSKLTIILRTLRHSSSYTPIDYCSLKRPDIIEYR
jgi:hypothetical protein